MKEMAIRKRYVGRIRVNEATADILVESAQMSKIESFKGKILPHVVREVFDSALSEAGISTNDIDAFCVANSMSGLYGIPEFMRYVLPTSLGGHKPVYEVGCEESAGLCAVSRACDLIRSGLFSRVCVISANKVQLEGIEELSKIIFTEVINKVQSVLQEYIRKSGIKSSKVKDIFSLYLRRAKKNPFASAYSPTRMDIYAFPKLLDGVGVAILSSSSTAVSSPSHETKRKQQNTPKGGKVRIIFSGEATAHASGHIIESARFLSDQAYEKLKIKNPKDEIKVFEVYDFIPPFSLVWIESLGLSEGKKGVEILLEENGNSGKAVINPSGGVFFSNSPPVSSFARFFEVYRFLTQNGKSGDKGLCASVSLRSLEHSALIIAEKV